MPFIMTVEPKLRPFYIHVVVWGERFRHYLLDYCIPSLLSPLNLPNLKNAKENKLLICTPSQDWECIIAHPIFSELCKYATPVFVEIPPAPPHLSGCQHMGVGHKLATEICFQDRAYGIAVTPDLVLSDGTLTYIEKRALEGKHIVFCAAIRFAEEPFFAHLKKLNLESNETYNRKTALKLTGPVLVDCAINSFHSETSSYDYNAPYYRPNAPITLQTIENEGLLVHSMSWCPLLLDYGAISQHDTHALENWTIDGDYVYRNFEQTQAIDISTDSNDVMLLSWAPLVYNPVKLSSSLLRRYSKRYNTWFNSMTMRATLQNPIYDPMKIKFFSLPVYWHRLGINAKWMELEKIFQAQLSRPRNFADTCFVYYVKLLHVFSRIRHFSYISFKAFLGDQDAFLRIKRKIANLIHRKIQNESR